MSSFAQRRFVNLTLAFLVGALLVLFNTLYEMSLRDAAFLNGWLLFAGMVFLTLFNARKKLPFLPLMAASTWLQVHVYLGLICALLFFLHCDFRLPNGQFEILLWSATVALFVTGLIGLVISRRLPLRLRAGGERILFERIPSFRAQLANEAETYSFSKTPSSRFCKTVNPARLASVGEKGFATRGVLTELMSFLTGFLQRGQTSSGSRSTGRLSSNPRAQTRQLFSGSSGVSERYS